MSRTEFENNLIKTGATHRNKIRAEYILKHYAKSDIEALARDLDRCDAGFVDYYPLQTVTTRKTD